MGVGGWNRCLDRPWFPFPAEENWSVGPHTPRITHPCKKIHMLWCRFLWIFIKPFLMLSPRLLSYSSHSSLFETGCCIRNSSSINSCRGLVLKTCVECFPPPNETNWSEALPQPPAGNSSVCIATYLSGKSSEKATPFNHLEVNCNLNGAL